MFSVGCGHEEILHPRRSTIGSASVCSASVRPIRPSVFLARMTFPPAWSKRSRKESTTRRSPDKAAEVRIEAGESAVGRNWEGKVRPGYVFGGGRLSSEALGRRTGGKVGAEVGANDDCVFGTV